MDWRLPLNVEGFNVDLNSSLVYQSKTNFDINQNPNAFQSAYAVWDAGVRFSTSDDKYSLSFIVKNLTDKQFVIQRIPNGTSFMRQITPREGWQIEPQNRNGPGEEFSPGPLGTVFAREPYRCGLKSSSPRAGVSSAPDRVCDPWCAGRRA